MTPGPGTAELFGLDPGAEADLAFLDLDAGFFAVGGFAAGAGVGGDFYGGG